MKWQKSPKRQAMISRDGLVVSTLRCGCNDPVSNSGHNILLYFVAQLLMQFL